MAGKNISWRPVISKRLKAIGYDGANQILYAQFPNGRIAIYQGVSPKTYSSLLRAKSIGTYFNKHIGSVLAYDYLR